jgi:uncharacterized membrane protein
MKPLIVLVAVFIVAAVAIRLIEKEHHPFLAARIAMTGMLFFTAIGHFTFTKGMVMMIPPFIPSKVVVVYLTGVLEVVLGAGLLVPSVKIYAGYSLILFFVLLLPANIYAAINHVDFQKATFDGNGPLYLWFRVPLQVIFIAWTYLSAIKVHS